jgi:hypothetical protein
MTLGKTGAVGRCPSRWVQAGHLGLAYFHRCSYIAAILDRMAWGSLVGLVGDNESPPVDKHLEGYGEGV